MGKNVKFGGESTLFRNRLNKSKGADVASATSITLGRRGNYFKISGTTTTSYIKTAGWKAGAEVTLEFGGALTLSHAAGSAGTGYAELKLQGAGNLTTAAGDTVTLAYDGTYWRETARSIVAGISAAAIADGILVGTEVAVVANVNVIGGIPLVFRTAVASGANGDVDITTTHKIRVINAWVVLNGAGTAGCTLTLKSTATAISDAVNVASGGDRDRYDVGEIDDASHEIAAAGVIRWSKASTGGDFPGAECYVLAVRVA